MSNTVCGQAASQRWCGGCLLACFWSPVHPTTTSTTTIMLRPSPLSLPLPSLSHRVTHGRPIAPACLIPNDPLCSQPPLSQRCKLPTVRVETVPALKRAHDVAAIRIGLSRNGRSVQDEAQSPRASDGTIAAAACAVFSGNCHSRE